MSYRNINGNRNHLGNRITCWISCNRDLHSWLGCFPVKRCKHPAETCATWCNSDCRIKIISKISILNTLASSPSALSLLCSIFLNSTIYIYYIYSYVYNLEIRDNLMLSRSPSGFMQLSFPLSQWEINPILFYISIPNSHLIAFTTRYSCSHLLSHLT